MDIYEGRKLVEGFPSIERLAHEAYAGQKQEEADTTPRVSRLLTYLGRLIDLNGSRTFAVVGCGPHPQTVKILHEKGYRAVGVEPVPSFVEAAAAFVGDGVSILEGSAEALPLSDDACDVVLLENVLEHVDSIPQSLAECFRVIKPGGILVLMTNSRHRFDLRGRNGEFDIPFYNWLPALLKESYVFEHLHYNPSLASFTERPAVHWSSYAGLCRAGRDAGFCRFYSIIDLMRPSDKSVASSLLRRFLLTKIQRSPVLRSLALTQIGGTIVMYKRPASRAHPKLERRDPAA